MAFLADLQAELQTIIAAVWTDVPYVIPDQVHKSGFYTSVQTLKEQIVEALKASDIPFPCVILEFGEEDVCEDFAIDGDAYYLPVAIHRIEPWGATASGGANQNSLAATCRSLKAAIDDQDHVQFQAISRGSIDTSDANPVLAALSGDSKVQLIAATVRWDRILVMPNG